MSLLILIITLYQVLLPKLQLTVQSKFVLEQAGLVSLLCVQCKDLTTAASAGKGCPLPGVVLHQPQKVYSNLGHLWKLHIRGCTQLETWIPSCLHPLPTLPHPRTPQNAVEILRSRGIEGCHRDSLGCPQGWILLYPLPSARDLYCHLCK